MKTKIKAALQQKYPQLGLADEVFEGVASAVETLIADEAGIPAFVDGAEAMLKRYQSYADKLRGQNKLNDDLAAANKRAEELEAKVKELEGKQTPPTQTPPAEPAKEPDGGKDLAELIAKTVSEALKPLQDDLNAFKGERDKTTAVSAAKEAFFANEYAKKYTTERDDAWERAVEVNDLTGGKMNAEELGKKAMEYFDRLVARKDVDTSKPFKPEPNEGNGEELDTDEIRRACGLEPKKSE